VRLEIGGGDPLLGRLRAMRHQSHLAHDQRLFLGGFVHHGLPASVFVII
jgi:hypothetical protein